MTSLSVFALAVGIATNHSDAAQTGNTHKCVDNAADGTPLAAKEKCTAGEAEEATGTPVQRTEPKENQCDLVNNFQKSDLPKIAWRR